MLIDNDTWAGASQPEALTLFPVLCSTTLFCFFSTLPYFCLSLLSPDFASSLVPPLNLIFHGPPCFLAGPLYLENITDFKNRGGHTIWHILSMRKQPPTQILQKHELFSSWIEKNHARVVTLTGLACQCAN